MNKRVLFVVLFAVFSAAFLFRFYRLSETIRFSADQGLDMVSIWQMQTTGTLPLVGPFLSIPDVYTPPTYYFINWGLYRITQSVVGMVHLYALINLITMAILVRLAYEMKGLGMAVVTGVLYATSNVMIDHSRSFWQPYPVQFFLVLSLFLLWRAQKHRTVRSLWTGVFFYVFAVSIYPSPILLLPLVTWRIMLWYRQNKRVSISWSLAASAATLIASFLIVYSPQIYFEYTRGFPTLANVFAGYHGLYELSPIVSVVQNLTELITVFFATDRLPYSAMIAVTLGIGGLLSLLFWICPKKTASPVLSFFPVWIVLLGFFGFLFYPFEVHHHRAWAFLPLALLGFADCLENALTRKGIARTLAILLLGIYVGTNLHGGWHYWTGETRNTITLTKQVAYFIGEDMQKRQVADTDAGFFYKVPNDPENGSYGIYRILFWLLRDKNLSFPLDTANIHLPHDYSTPVLKPYMYIICRGFDSEESIRDHCVGAVIMREQYTILRMQKFQNITVVVLNALSSSVSSLHVPE